jgi:hypothetical protein
MQVQRRAGCRCSRLPGSRATRRNRKDRLCCPALTDAKPATPLRNSVTLTFRPPIADSRCFVRLVRTRKVIAPRSRLFPIYHRISYHHSESTTLKTDGRLLLQHHTRYTQQSLCPLSGRDSTSCFVAFNNDPGEIGLLHFSWAS